MRERVLRGGEDRLFAVEDLLDLLDEPWVDLGPFDDVFRAHAGLQGRSNVENAVAVGDPDAVAQQILKPSLFGDRCSFKREKTFSGTFLISAQTLGADLKAAQRFLQSFFERAAERHHFAD